MRLQRRLHRGPTAKAPPHLPFVIVGRSAGFHVTAQGQQPELVRAVEEIFVGKLSWLGDHDDEILQRPAQGHPLGFFEACSVFLDACRTDAKTTAARCSLLYRFAIALTSSPGSVSSPVERRKSVPSEGEVEQFSRRATNVLSTPAANASPS